MRRIELLAGMLSASLLCAQVVSPPEIRDPELRELQQKHFAELKAVAVAIASHQFPYRFYFSRTLDLNEDQQKTRDQRSIQFAKYGHQTVVEILGNYYAAYSDELMKREERARRTFEDVMLPMLRAEVSQLSDEPKMQGFALEISHHVRKKVLGVSGEHAENVVLVIPKAAALRLVSAPDEATQAVALEEGSLFINGEAATIWGRMTADPPAAPVPAPAPAAGAGGVGEGVLLHQGGAARVGGPQPRAPPRRSGSGPRSGGGGGGEARPNAATYSTARRCCARAHTRRPARPANVLPGNLGQASPRTGPDSALCRLRTARIRELSQRYLPAALDRHYDPGRRTGVPVPRGGSGL